MKRTILSLLIISGFGLPSGAQQPPGSLVWSYAAAAPIVSAPGILPDHSILISAGADIFAVTNAGSFGSNRWALLNASPANTPAISADGTFYFGDRSPGCSLNAVGADGARKWSLALQPQFQYQIRFQSSPAIGVDRRVFFAAGGWLFCVSAAGVKEWQAQIDDPPGGPVSPVVGPEGNVYVGSTSLRTFYAFSPSGSNIWSQPLASLGGDSPAIGNAGCLYYAASSLNSFTSVGSLQWSTGGGSSGSPVLGRDGTVYTSMYGRVLDAVSSGGVPLWQALDKGGLPQYGESTSPAVGGGDEIYYCVSNSVWALDLRGRVLWKLTSPDQPPANTDAAMTSPTLGPDGTLYAVLGGNLYAISTGTNGPANSPWPMYRGNAQHTGRIQKPSLQNPKKRADANFEFQLFSQTGTSVSVESSTNLTTWNTLTSVVPAAAPEPIVDLTASNSPAKFYRAKGGG